MTDPTNTFTREGASVGAVGVLPLSASLQTQEPGHPLANPTGAWMSRIEKGSPTQGPNMAKDGSAPIEALRGKALWRELHREKVACPSCGANISRRTLRWKHVCPPREIDIAALRSAMDGRAMESFKSRVDSQVARDRERCSDDVHRGAVQESPLLAA